MERLSENYVFFLFLIPNKGFCSKRALLFGSYPIVRSNRRPSRQPIRMDYKHCETKKRIVLKVDRAAESFG